MPEDWLSLFALVGAILHWILLIGALFTVPVNRKPSSATAWLMLIALFPFAGFVLFLLIGSPKLPYERRLRQLTMDELVAKAISEARDHPVFGPLLNPHVPARYLPFANLSAHLGGMAAFAGNDVAVIDDYDEILRRLAEDIDTAEHFVHIQFYILNRDEATEEVFLALERAHQRGVQVRVMLDDFGSNRYPTSKQTDDYLKTSGFGYERILPVRLSKGQWARPDLRNHRKIAVIDGRIGHTGSLNLIRRDYFRKDDLYYDEVVVRVTGPIVGQLDAVFITDWYSETDTLLSQAELYHGEEAVVATGTMLCQVLPSGSGHDDENNLKLFTGMIHGAHHKLTIVNPYFVPDDSLMLALTSAAQRGVDVTMINSEAPDQFMVYYAQHSFYDELLRCGVKIALYKKPILLHSKFMTIDDDIAMVGSSNFDMRSFQLNLEVSMVCYDRKVVADLRQIEATYLERSMMLSRDIWAIRPLYRRLFENIARLTAALQ
ncbi:cardiolipin synthase [Candidatus Chloroploca sp. M-50]|uniref:Cardiolipin synthase n=1 Tax=Candidatus Chloroploca mongolica TaxID=2528176 RepID=A0ABS4DEM2_9CHLR|nr:cardiolipin synthase [Candidatus Chloroploca mongolica]MBP1467883.1 cardiolipin synthase [Candidatus Chloroploca mongolica]